MNSLRRLFASAPGSWRTQMTRNQIAQQGYDEFASESYKKNVVTMSLCGPALGRVGDGGRDGAPTKVHEAQGGGFCWFFTGLLCEYAGFLFSSSRSGRSNLEGAAGSYPRINWYQRRNIRSSSKPGDLKIQVVALRSSKVMSWC